MPDWIVLLPIAFLLIGGLLATVAARRLPAPVRPWIWLTFIVLEILTLVVNLFPSPHRIEISRWELASFTIGFQMDGITLLLLLMLFIILLVLQLVNPNRALNRREHIFVLASAALLISASDLYSAYFAWTLMDFAFLVLRRASGVDSAITLRALIVGQIAGLFLFVGAIFPDAVISSTGASIVALAFWARLGLYPFHWVMPREDLDILDVWIARGVPLLAGSSLWLHWKLWNVEAPTGLIATLSLVTLIATIVWIRREELPRDIVSVNIMSAAAFIPLTIVIGGEGSIAPALWMTSGIFLLTAAFNIAEGWVPQSSRWAQRVWFTGVLALAGMPLTPAFIGRADAYVWLWRLGQGLFLFIAAAATTIILAPLWKISVAGTESRKPTVLENAGLILYGLTFAVLALAPTMIASAVSPTLGDSVESVVDRMFRTSEMLDVGIGFIALLLPILISFLLSRTDFVSFQPSSFMQFLSHLIDLEWFAKAVARTAHSIGSSIQKISALAEENPTMWILLVFLWIAIFILTAR